MTLCSLRNHPRIGKNFLSFPEEGQILLCKTLKGTLGVFRYSENNFFDQNRCCFWYNRWASEAKHGKNPWHPLYQHIKISLVISRLSATFAGVCLEGSIIRQIRLYTNLNWITLRTFFRLEKHTGTQAHYRYATFSNVVPKNVSDWWPKVEGLLLLSLFNWIVLEKNTSLQLFFRKNNIHISLYPFVFLHLTATQIPTKKDKQCPRLFATKMPLECEQTHKPNSCALIVNILTIVFVSG